uniref:Uncharacterized protein n=1 Tax=Caenorhabditis japonica TaxID=281687 RepID=A0A8R1DVU4_CAEJA
MIGGLFFRQDYVVDLEPNHAAFHRNFKVYTADESHVFQREEYIGTVREPRPGKVVLTHLEKNQFIGVIYFSNDTLHFEASHPHGLDSDIIGYFGSDVDTKLDLSSLPTRNQMSFMPPNPFIRKKRDNFMSSARRSDLANEKYNRCSLKLVADYSFFSSFGKNNTGIVTKLLVNMVARLNEIYTPINWDEGKEDSVSGRGRFENMGFSIKEIKVLDRPNVSETHYNSYTKKWKVDKLLHNFAHAEGSNNFCLVHLITARTFEESEVLGLAFISNKNIDDTAGGICSKRETFNGRVSYINALLSTSFAYMDQTTYPLITKEVDIVVAHEYGHAWGAYHDPTVGSNDTDVAQCSPSDKDGGRFLMASVAQKGYDPNNVNFSPCSRKQIREVLSSKWHVCFEEEMTSFCGNGIIEDGEECDNGVGTDAIEVSCCDKFCRLNVGAKCSPLNHICCTSACQFHNSSHICLQGDSLLCKADAVCNGFSGDCPSAPPVADGTECIEDGECLNGVCLPFCEKKSIGKKSCICEDLELSCRRCCRDKHGNCSPMPGLTFLRDGMKCTKGTCKDKKCVSEVIDNVRNYFLAPFQDQAVFLESMKTHLVVVVVFIVSFLFLIIYQLVNYLEKYKLENPKPLEHFRRVIVSWDDK